MYIENINSQVPL